MWAHNLRRTPGPTPHLLLLPLSGSVAPLDLPVAEEVAEVAEDGEDAVAHVGEHRHQHGCLLVGLNEGPPVQAAVSDLKENNRKSQHSFIHNIQSWKVLNGKVPILFFLNL